MPLRTFCTIFLFFAVCAFPLYFTVAVGLFSVIWFRDYWELIPLYFLHDALYGVPLERFHSIPLVMTITAAVAVAIVALVGRRAFGAAPHAIRIHA